MNRWSRMQEYHDFSHFAGFKRRGQKQTNKAIKCTLTDSLSGLMRPVRAKKHKPFCDTPSRSCLLRPVKLIKISVSIHKCISRTDEWKERFAAHLNAERIYTCVNADWEIYFPSFICISTCIKCPIKLSAFCCCIEFFFFFLLWQLSLMTRCLSMLLRSWHCSSGRGDKLWQDISNRQLMQLCHMSLLILVVPKCWLTIEYVLCGYTPVALQVSPPVFASQVGETRGKEVRKGELRLCKREMRRSGCVCVPTFLFTELSTAVGCFNKSSSSASAYQQQSFRPSLADCSISW